MKVEIKTKSLKEILQKCENLGWDIKDVKLEEKIFERIDNPDQYYVKLYIKNKIKKHENKKRICK
jgi:imidazoleglycerol phosphate synthase glutamine amidotransferase subunit HisH